MLDKKPTISSPPPPKGGGFLYGLRPMVRVNQGTKSWVSEEWFERVDGHVQLSLLPED